jgi:glycosyltransferase involved in cell wall biosynthesis
MSNFLFSVTNDLTYDQRMQRICTTLATHGHEVTLVGRLLPGSLPVDERPYRQVRLRCRFHKGFAFYAEYNLRLWWWLMRQPTDGVCSIDYDTLPAGCLATLLRGKRRFFDAHEYFTEVPEVVNRPFVRFFWEMVARACLPFYQKCYTVGPCLAAVFEKKYGLKFAVVRNVPVSRGATMRDDALRSGIPQYILYQGALNEGRGIEALLQAMKHIEGVELWLAGEGDLSEVLRQQCVLLGVQQKVRFLGFVKPDALRELTEGACIGLNLLENRGLSYYYSLANKFFDYVHAAIPVITMRFPEYEALCREHEVGILLDDLEVPRLVQAIRQLLDDPALYAALQENCRSAAAVWNWEKEQQQLLAVFS